jgi:hypothetical protein
VNRNFETFRAADQGTDFDPESMRAIGLAFDKACQALGLRAQPDPTITRPIAEKIIEFARRGERDPDQLSRLTVRALTGGESNCF